MRRESMVLPIVMIKKSASLKVVRCFVHRESCRGSVVPYSWFLIESSRLLGG
jgi:hypothetical protein